MRKTTLFIAMSLDGYIARGDGSVDWLRGENPSCDDMESYHRFIKEIDTVIMGFNTYEQITTSLSPHEWAYKGLTSYVLTHRSVPAKEEIVFLQQDVCSLVKSLQKQPGKGIWICGGARTVRPLIRENLIDLYHLSIIPALLGDGIRLFETAHEEKLLKLKDIKSYNGITDLIYAPRKPAAAMDR